MRASIAGWLPDRRVRLSRAEEAELARRACRGDQAAVETLVAAMAPWIARLVVDHFGPRGRRLRDRVAEWEPLDDLLQQGVLAMLERLPSFDAGRGRLTTWLGLVVVQGVARWRHRHRSVIARPAYVGGRNAAAQARAGQVAPLDAAPWRFPAAAPDPAEELDRRAQLAALDAAIEGLAPRLRAVIRGRLAGRSLAELAAELQVSKARVGQLARDAERRIEAALTGRLHAPRAAAPS